MSTKMVSVKMPEWLADELQKVSLLESLKHGRGRPVTVSSILRDLATDFVRRERQCGPAQMVAAR